MLRCHRHELWCNLHNSVQLFNVEFCNFYFSLVRILNWIWVSVFSLSRLRDIRGCVLTKWLLETWGIFIFLQLVKKKKWFGFQPNKSRFYLCLNVIAIYTTSCLMGCFCALNVEIVTRAAGDIQCFS